MYKPLSEKCFLSKLKSTETVFLCSYVALDYSYKTLSKDSKLFHIYTSISKRSEKKCMVMLNKNQVIEL